LVRSGLRCSWPSYHRSARRPARPAMPGTAGRGGAGSSSNSATGPRSASDPALPPACELGSAGHRQASCRGTSVCVSDG
jgi:hypothetical protein